MYVCVTFPHILESFKKATAQFSLDIKFYFSDRNRGWEAIKLTDRQMLYDNDTISHWRRSHTRAFRSICKSWYTLFACCNRHGLLLCKRNLSSRRSLQTIAHKLADSRPRWCRCFTQRATFVRSTFQFSIRVNKRSTDLITFNQFHSCALSRRHDTE